MHNEGNRAVFIPHEEGDDAPNWVEIRSQGSDERKQNEQIGKAALGGETTAERLSILKEKAKKVVRPIAIAAAVIVVSGATIHSFGGEQTAPTPRSEVEWSSDVESTLEGASNLQLVYREDGGSEITFDNGIIGDDFVHYRMVCDDSNIRVVKGSATKSGGEIATYEAEEGYGLDPSVVKQILDVDLGSRME